MRLEREAREKAEREKQEQAAKVAAAFQDKKEDWAKEKAEMVKKAKEELEVQKNMAVDSDKVDAEGKMLSGGDKGPVADGTDEGVDVEGAKKV